MQCLAGKGLTAGTLIANFHRQRVLPLMERRLAIFELTPEATVEGSRMARRSFSRDIAAQRAKRTVAAFPSNPADLWVIKMRHEAGYIQLVRIVFYYL